MDNNINKNDSLEEYRAQQFQDQRQPAGQQPPGFRPPMRPTPPGSGPARPPMRHTPPGPGPARPPMGPTPPGPGPARPPMRPTPPGLGPVRPPMRPTPPSPGQVRPPSGQIPPGISAPRSAPPDFVPAGPFTEGGVGRAPAQFRERFRGDMRTRPRDFYRCMNSFTYIWLVNGNNFWFFPIFIDRQFVIGFRWRRNRWEFDRINLNRILFFACF